MQETAESLRSTRIAAGVSLEEVSNDIGISVIILEQIEDGSIGSFDNIYELKTYLVDYAKYLGLNTDQVIKKFNEYMFDYTSRIPMDEIEKAVKAKEKEKEDNDRVFSPYTKITPIEKKAPFIIALIIIIILMILAVLWSINKIKENKGSTNLINVIRMESSL